MTAQVLGLMPWIKVTKLRLVEGNSRGLFPTNALRVQATGWTCRHNASVLEHRLHAWHHLGQDNNLLMNVRPKATR